MATIVSTNSRLRLGCEATTEASATRCLACADRALKRVRRISLPILAVVEALTQRT